MMRSGIVFRADSGRRLRSGRTRSAGLLLAGIALAGCGESEPPAPAGIQRADSAGIEIVSVPGPVVDSLPLLILDPQPVLTLPGSRLEELGLTAIVGALILPDLRIAVADAALAQVAVVGPDGSIGRRIGRRGDAPGEVAEVASLTQRGPDELVLWDGSRGRLVVFDTAGNFRETIATPPERTAGRGVLFPGFLADGSPVFPHQEPLGTERFDGVRRRDFAVERYAPDGSYAGRLATLPGQFMAGVTVSGIWMTTPVPLSGGPRLAVGGGRAHRGHGDRFELQTWSGAGLERITRIDRARQEAPSEVREAARAAAVAELTLLPFDLGGEVDASGVPVSNAFPAFDRLLADSDGAVWMEEGAPYGEGVRSWIVFDPTGAPVARVLIPEGLDLLDIRGTLVLGVTWDEAGVPIVALLRLIPAMPGSA